MKLVMSDRAIDIKPSKVCLHDHLIQLEIISNIIPSFLFIYKLKKAFLLIRSLAVIAVDLGCLLIAVVDVDCEIKTNAQA